MHYDNIKVQINDYDTYRNKPLKLDKLQNRVVQVPIIRIFGSISIPALDGKTHVHNVLVHVHNVFPYLYVDCRVTDVSVLKSEDFITNITNFVENGLRESFQRRGPGADEDDEDGNEEDVEEFSDVENKRKYVADISICKGVPIYGYQVGYQLKYKISLLSQAYKTRLTRIITEKQLDISDWESQYISVAKKKSNKRLQTVVYESHFPFILQFLTDYNLYGCGLLELSYFFLRYPVINRNLDASPLSSLKLFLQPLIGHNVLNPKFHHRIGRSLLEIDVTAHDIVNRTLLIPRNIHHDFSEMKNSQHLSHDKIIYLSSIKSIYDDLRFQCQLRSQPQSFLDTQNVVDSSIGAGSTEWPNEQHQSNLLKYVIELNGTSSTGDIDLYYDKTYKPSLNFTNHFPTTFEQVDIERRQIKFQSLNMDPEILKAYKFDSLFDPKQQLDKSLGDNVLKSSTSMTYSQILNLSFISDSSSSSDESEKEDEVPEHNDSEYDDPINMDSQTLYEISQIQRKRKFSDISNSSMNDSNDPLPVLQVASSSKTSNASQDDNFADLISTPNHAYQVLVPETLQRENLMKSFQDLNLLKVNYIDPFMASKSDIPAKPFIFSNRKIPVPHINDHFKNPFSSTSVSHLTSRTSESKPETVNGLSTWQYTIEPPLELSVTNWVKKEDERLHYRRKFRSQIEPGVTQTNDYKFSYESEKITRDSSAFTSLTNFYLELHVNTFTDMLPNPETDPVNLIFYKFQDFHSMFELPTLGILIYLTEDCDEEYEKKLKKTLPFLDDDEPTNMEIFRDEKTMVDRLLDIISTFDPDILSGYEINASSWGYLIERFRIAYDINLLASLSRCTFKSNGKLGDRWGYTHTSAIKINGRNLLNVWRIIKGELKITNYSIQNITYHLLHQTLPKYLNLQLSQWFSSGNVDQLLMVLKYYQKIVSLVLKIMYIQEMIIRNVEQARLVGIDFNSIAYRGSQYKVESLLGRIAKQESMLLNSPTKKEVHEMKPIECLPLILEPESNFYKSPLIVLDFQSLYPSVMIAYNYCYSTLLGKLNGFSPSKNHFGYIKNLNLMPGLVDLINNKNGINLSPNGLMFVKSTVRKSALAKMLESLLSTRVSIKSMMKLFKDDKELTRLYNSRQLAIKLIANVTYGYTSATFSGRMPNPDIADAIVATGQEILSKSIDLIESGNYGAKVVYGDTDSLFVYLPGKSKLDAFKLGNEISSMITSHFPDPIKLKFEKVYHPCVLLAKKRYVGYSYEFEDQVEPKFDAKGIETIRRDGIPAQQKMVEKTLRILFNTKNLSLVKSYTLNQFYKVLLNKVAIKDFCFAKEVRYGTYKNEKYLPPGAILAAEKVDKDPRSEPQYRERIPYLVIQDITKQRVKDRCVSPEDFINSFNTSNPYNLDHEYYITRVLIPPLARIFNLLGLDVKSWYRELPKIGQYQVNETDILNVSNFIRYNSCLKCGEKLSSYTPYKNMCLECAHDELSLVTDVTMTSQQNEIKFIQLRKTCNDCVDHNFLRMGIDKKVFENNCVNNTCVVYYNKIRVLSSTKNFQEKKMLILKDLDW